MEASQTTKTWQEVVAPYEMEMSAIAGEEITICGGDGYLRICKARFEDYCKGGRRVQTFETLDKALDYMRGN